MLLGDLNSLDPQKYQKPYVNMITFGEPRSWENDVANKLETLTDDYTWDIVNTEVYIADKDYNKIRLYKPYHNGLYYLNDIENYIAEINVKGEKKPYVFELSPRRHTITFRKDSITIHFSVKENEMNKGMNAYVDKVYGKPFDKAKNGECNKFIYKQIKGSEEKIEKLSRTIYAG